MGQEKIGCCFLCTGLRQLDPEVRSCGACGAPVVLVPEEDIVQGRYYSPIEWVSKLLGVVDANAEKLGAALNAMGAGPPPSQAKARDADERLEDAVRLFDDICTWLANGHKPAADALHASRDRFLLPLAKAGSTPGQGVAAGSLTQSGSAMVPTGQGVADDGNEAKWQWVHEAAAEVVRSAQPITGEARESVDGAALRELRNEFGRLGPAVPADELKGSRDRLVAVAPHLRLASWMAKIHGGRVQLGVLSTKEGGGGNVVAQFDAASFAADLCLILGVGVESEADDEEDEVDDQDTASASSAAKEKT